MTGGGDPRVPARRALLKAGACALVALGSAPRFLARAAWAGAARRRVLVAVFQRGAVDGLSMVVPFGDQGYARSRPSIGLQSPRRSDAERSIDLDGFFALHPALAPLHPWWVDGTLAVVHACGSPDPTRSHFDAQDYMEIGTPGVKSTNDGWLARAAAQRPEGRSPLRAVAMGPVLPRSLRGTPGAVAMTSIEAFDLGRPGAEPAPRHGFESLYVQPVADTLHGTGREAFEAVRMLRSAEALSTPPANGAAYPHGRFGASLRQIARLIRADIGLEIAFADSGGWDTHAGQGAEQGELAARLGELGGALAAFARDLGDRMADVVVLTMSEFGRTVAENGSRGTDHGHATAMLVLGGRVRGGRVYGRWPGLDRDRLYDGRDLAVTTDFRALFAELAAGHLGVPSPATLFPGWHPSEPLLGVLPPA